MWYFEIHRCLKTTGEVVITRSVDFVDYTEMSEFCGYYVQYIERYCHDHIIHVGHIWRKDNEYYG